MATISSIAMYFTKNDGILVMEWLGWHIETNVSIFILITVISTFFSYIFFRSISVVVFFPKRIVAKMKNRKLKKLNNSIKEGIIAISYGNKDKVIKCYENAKSIKIISPSYLLLELQYFIYKRNSTKIFDTFKLMLKYNSTKPIAIKGLINVATKNKDVELFKNMLLKVNEIKLDHSLILNEGIKFCLNNNEWITLSNFLEEKKGPNKKMMNTLSIINFKIAKDFYNKNDHKNASLFIKKALKFRDNFPPVIKLYCDLNLIKSKREAINMLHKYWSAFPHPNIADCIAKVFLKEDDIKSKLKLFNKVLKGNDSIFFKYTILGKLKIEAGIWGEAKNDLEKSIRLKESKRAYYLLAEVEEKLSKDQAKILKLKQYSKQCIDTLEWKCEICSSSSLDWQVFCKNCESFNSFIWISDNKYGLQKKNHTRNFFPNIL